MHTHTHTLSRSHRRRTCVTHAHSIFLTHLMIAHACRNGRTGRPDGRRSESWFACVWCACVLLFYLTLQCTFSASKVTHTHGRTSARGARAHVFHMNTGSAGTSIYYCFRKRSVFPFCCSPVPNTHTHKNTLRLHTLKKLRALHFATVSSNSDAKAKVYTCMAVLA